MPTWGSSKSVLGSDILVRLGFLTFENKEIFSFIWNRFFSFGKTNDFKLIFYCFDCSLTEPNKTNDWIFSLTLNSEVSFIYLFNTKSYFENSQMATGVFFSNLIRIISFRHFFLQTLLNQLFLVQFYMKCLFAFQYICRINRLKHTFFTLN